MKALVKIRNLTLALAIYFATAAAAQTQAPGAVPVRGKTVDTDGHPLAGVVIQQYGYEWMANAPGLEVRQQVTSDTNGEFQLQVSRAPTSAQAPVILVARRAQLASAWRQFTPIPGATLRLALTPPSFLAGRVVDEADKPVSGAAVSVATAFSEVTDQGPGRFMNYLSDKAARDLFTANTDANGRFRIEGFPTNASAALIAEAPGKAMRWTGPSFFSPDAMPCRAGQEDIRLIMEAAGGIEGKIVSGDRQSPPAHVTLQADSPGTLLAARGGIRSEADGTFRLRDLPAGSYRLRAAFGTNESSDWVAETVPATVEIGQMTRGVQITAVRGGILEVAIRSSTDAKPIEEVGMNLFKDGYQAALASHPNGLGAIRLPPGSYQINAFKQGWQQASASATVEDGKTNRVEMELTPSRKLAGIVRMPEGQPASNVPLQVIGDFSMQQANLRTGPDGKFEFDWNPQRFAGNNVTPCLLVRDPAHNLALAEDLGEESDKLDLRLAPAVSFAVRVECDGKPVANATAGLLFRTGNMGMYLNGMASPAKTAGEIEILALPPGRHYGVQISAPGYGSRFVDLEQRAEEAKRVELDPVELRRADHKISGKLVDTDDKPVSGAMVRANGDGQPNASTVTDKQGRFSLDICEGTVRLFANSQRNFANLSAEAGDTNVVMRLGERSGDFGGAKPQKVKGTVTDPNGKPLAGADVRVFQMNMPSRAKTDSNGVFSVSYVVQPWQQQNGNPLLVVRDRTHNLAGTQEILNDSTNVTVQLEAALTLNGHVVGADGKPLANATVSLMLQAGRTGGPLEEQPLTTDAQGAFSFKTLPVGQDYSLFATAPGYSQKRQKVQSDWDKNVAEIPPMVLRIPDQIVAGRVVDAKDKPLPGVQVQLEADDQPEGSMQTDRNGRFKFKVCPGQVRMFANGPMGFAQSTAEAGDTNVVILLTDPSMRRQPVVRQKATNVFALKGKPLPDLAPFGFGAEVIPTAKPILLCLLDVQQRPSRRVARLLTRQLDALRGMGVTVLALQTVASSQEAWDDWKEAYPVSFPIRRLSDKSDQAKWASALEDLPWLVLVDKKGIVVDEGFPLDELMTKLEDLNK